MDMVQRAVWRSCAVLTQTKLEGMFFKKKIKTKVYVQVKSLKVILCAFLLYANPDRYSQL